LEIDVTTLPVTPPNLQAVIRFLSPEEGGKQIAAKTGFRPLFSLDGENWISVHEYVDPPEALPGQDVLTNVYLLSPERIMDRVQVGTEFDVFEGSRLVARGRVTELMDRSIDA
jgi:translation elongation factor EF-Tu-like GTPase